MAARKQPRKARQKATKKDEQRTLKLTITAIKNAGLPEAHEKTGYILWDTEVKGLGCRVSPKGKKSFVLFYRTLDGTQRKPGIGTFGSITLEKAREIAQDMLADVRTGGDPSQARAESRKAPTVAEVCDRYIEEYAKPYKKPSSVYTDELYIRLHIKPQLGGKKAARVVLKDVAVLHRRLKDTPYQANRVISLVSKILSLCEEWEVRSLHSNPCGRIKRFTEKTRHRPMNELEIARLSKVLLEVESSNDPSISENPRAVAAIRLLLFTGCRRNEVLKLRWSEVDLDQSVLRLGDSKTGEKVVRLNTAATEVIQAQEPMLNNPHVFPSPRLPGRPLFDVNGPWRRIRARAGLNDVRLHDLRHNFAAAAAGGGLSLYQIGQLLGHRSPRTTARYSDLTDDPARRAAEQVGQTLTEAMNKKVEEG